jgi:cell wall-associated NlpC family hydrolase
MEVPVNVDIPSFFDSHERRAHLLEVARLWDRTPFFPNSEAPGRNGGVDCVHLLHAVYFATGAIPFVAIPPQVMDHGQHSERSVLEEAFDTWPALVARFRRLPESFPEHVRPGDALLFRAGKIPHHSAIMLLGRELLHVMAPAGVHRVRLDVAIRGESIVGRLRAIYRPIPLPC